MLRPSRYLIDEQRPKLAAGHTQEPTLYSLFMACPMANMKCMQRQASLSGETLISPRSRSKFKAADVTGISLAVAPTGSIDGRVILESDPKAACGKHRSSALLETMIFARRA